MPSEPLHRLVVYSREYCSLCETMVRALERVRADTPFILEVVDIEDNPELEERFGKRVPVLLINGEEVCHYHLDLRVLSAYLTKIR